MYRKINSAGRPPFSLLAASSGFAEASMMRFFVKHDVAQDAQ
jgi:hypothetical protein